MSKTPLVRVHQLTLDAPGGRPLFRDLSMTLSLRDQVALVGRNGVGKSFLLDVLAGNVAPRAGQIFCPRSRILVPQRLPWNGDSGQSPGEIRKQLLRDAFDARPDLLLLDEPTHDLDAEGINWLIHWLKSWNGGLVIVSHDRRILRLFHEFFIVAESGCRHFNGGYDDFAGHLNEEAQNQEERYTRDLARLVDKERRGAADRRRRQRKKNLGRLHELSRCPSRIKLNDKRSYAQVKQGKRAVRRDARLDAARQWARAARRALSVKLPLEAMLPRLPPDEGAAIAHLDSVSARAEGRVLFKDISVGIGRQRLAITGPNGSGKTALVEILVGDREPDEGRAKCDRSRIGYVSQNSLNWRSKESVLEHLVIGSDGRSDDDAAQILSAHKFPFALAERPLMSLSPGERLRAALICLWQRKPAPELLILDEPTNHLDFVGLNALERLLAAWCGGLVVVSHDEEFLQTIGVQKRLKLPGEICACGSADEGAQSAIRR